MKKKQKDKIYQSLKLVTAAFALLALLVAGAFSFEVTFNDQSAEKLENLKTNVATIEPSAEETSKASEGVSTDKESTKKTSAQLFAVVALSGSTDKYKNITDHSHTSIESNYEFEDLKLVAPVTNIWSISDRLGRRFTLVGAKPDGTS